MRAMLKKLILWALADGSIPATSDPAGLDKQAAGLK